MKNIIVPKYTDSGMFIKEIRSFVIRKKKIKNLNIVKFNQYWNLYGIDFTTNKYLKNIFFKKNNPIILEIGFGNGIDLIKESIMHENINYLGIEVYFSGLFSCLKNIFQKKIQNLKVIYHDAKEVLEYMVVKRTLNKVRIFFPDPWNKKKHRKRRLINKSFLLLLYIKLVDKGKIHILTDSENYIQEIINNIILINKVNCIFFFKLKKLFFSKNIETTFLKKCVSKKNSFFSLKIFKI
ncbi:tRNA (guanosine(46)-N7)-methyltransferase TrmB [Buchnera aphidicola (Thelaxes californica)]|uniref:tRNA (guanine-N(7)-)-methyltransferase n=1 Tax=Buchnera aphidicola (Thelaxes californica) TaxID=1315998 RepID=A0A4D6YJZ8_9GAMM|nr:tRNA (guanosine(46)-N7)-methyltransferase TrmB [Buchnera aphidicola]QCI26951.1 tRNA (guanosine(46)-N7)-methyltransferase TrmB [Buchnera aphidicola (Thelaxes californica)]